MEYEIEIDLGDLGNQSALVSGLIDSDNNVTLTEVKVTILGKQINVVSMLTDSAKDDFERVYLVQCIDDEKSIDGKYLYDEHNYS